MRIGAKTWSAACPRVVLTIFGAGLLIACNDGGKVADSGANNPTTAVVSATERTPTLALTAEPTVEPAPTPSRRLAAAATATDVPESTPIPVATITLTAEPVESESDSARDGVREIRVDTTEQLAFNPSDIDVDPGETVRFVLSNRSPFSHTFTIAVASSKGEILVDVTLGPSATETAEFTFPAEPATSPQSDDRYGY
jgi:plastocyanin